jgi:hypothetical protein
MPPVLLLALGALCAYATYRFLRVEAERAEALRAEAAAAAAASDVHTLVRDPQTGVYRPQSPLA